MVDVDDAGNGDASHAAATLNEPAEKPTHALHPLPYRLGRGPTGGGGEAVGAPCNTWRLNGIIGDAEDDAGTVPAHVDGRLVVHEWRHNEHGVRTRRTSRGAPRHRRLRARHTLARQARPLSPGEDQAVHAPVPRGASVSRRAASTSGSRAIRFVGTTPEGAGRSGGASQQVRIPSAPAGRMSVSKLSPTIHARSAGVCRRPSVSTKIRGWGLATPRVA